MDTDASTVVADESEALEAAAEPAEDQTEDVEGTDEPTDDAVTAALEAVAELATPTDERPAAEDVTLPEQTSKASQVKWQAILLVEDALTEDGRYIAPGATSWRELPLSLMAMTVTPEQGGHGLAFLAGRIDNIWREGNLIMGSGVFNDDTDGSRVAQLVAERFLTGNSVDLAVREFELAPRSDFDENGHRVRESDAEIDPLEAIFGGEDMVFVFQDCVIGMSTVCPFPAFADAEITVTASALQWRATRQSGMIVVAASPPEQVEEEEVAATDVEAIIAAAELVASVSIPAIPPADWFAAPELDGPTPLTITEDGRVFGHAALWDTCHIGIADVCTTAPHSITNYAYFLLGEVDVEDGSPVATGRITLGTGHAAKHLRWKATAEHYDDTGAAAADVTAGEDAYGIWVAGALRPDLTEERVRELRGSTLSGDWRNINGNLELVGLLAVNVPGFPVPRALVAAGSNDEPEILSLLAAGIVGRRTELTRSEESRLGALAARADNGLEGLVELAVTEAA